MNASFGAAASPRLHGAFELPHERAARVAVRRLFVELKQCFIEAVADVPGALGDSLRHDVRQATEVAELWLLRRAVLAALPPTEVRGATQRARLTARLEAAFVQRAADDTAFVVL